MPRIGTVSHYLCRIKNNEEMTAKKIIIPVGFMDGKIAGIVKGKQ